MSEREDDRRVVSALGEHGVYVSSIWDLVHTKQGYKEAIPVLIDMLSKVDDLGIKEGLVRALTVKEAAPVAALPLIKEFRQLMGDQSPRAGSVRWAIANALTVVAGKDSSNDVIELLKSPASGRARQMLALTLGRRLKDARGIPILIDLLDEEDVVGHAVEALGLLKAAEAQSHLLKLKRHPRTWVRKEVEKALKRIEGKPTPAHREPLVN